MRRNIRGARAARIYSTESWYSLETVSSFAGGEQPDHGRDVHACARDTRLAASHVNTPVPNGKRCEQCGPLLEWAGHGFKFDSEWDDMREGIFKCPQDCEVWTYIPNTARWRKH